MNLLSWIARACLPAVLAAPLLAAGWTDRGEYDLVMTLRSEAAAHRRVELLDLWKSKYPQTELRQVRLELYMAAYAELADGAHMLKTAREILAGQPSDPVGLYWCTLLVPEVKEPSPDTLEAGEKAARQLLAGLGTVFTDAAKPAAMSDVDWRKHTASVELLAHRTLGWVAWQRGDYSAAEAEFRLYLEKNPRSAEISAWVGMVSGLQKDPEKQAAALWHLERAAALTGEGALSDNQRRQVAALADRSYSAYHGESDGLEDLKTAALAAAFPPRGFHVETAAAVAARRADEQLDRTNPQLAAWFRIRRQLESPDADKYFTETLRAAPLPKLKGTVMRVSPDGKPSEIVLDMSQSMSEEIVLKLSSPFPNAAAPGTELEFEGTADSFTRQPFSLTVLVDRDKIAGWPAEPPVTPRSRK